MKISSAMNSQKPLFTNLGEVAQEQIVGGIGTSVYDQAGDLQARWEMKNTVPTKYELASLKVDDSQLLLETIVLVHEGVE